MKTSRPFCTLFVLFILVLGSAMGLQAQPYAENPWGTWRAPALPTHLAWERYQIEGFVWPASILPGEPVKLYVSVHEILPSDNSQQYDIRIYKARALLNDSLVYLQTNVAGQFFPLHTSSGQPIPWGNTDTSKKPIEYKRGCLQYWQDGLVTVTPTGSWPGGLYYATLIHRADTTQKYWVGFVIRTAIPGSTSKILFKYELNTYQAYNYWGGGSLYSDTQDTTSLAVTDTVAMDRPLTLIESQSHEYLAQHFLKVLADSGYSMEYCNNIDIDKPGTQGSGFGIDLLSKYNMLVLWDHDEYWSPNDRDNTKAFISNHGNIARFAPNTCYWRVNWDSTDNGVGPHRRLICRKGIYQPPRQDLWRDLGPEFHEARFLGCEYEIGYNLQAPSDSLLRPDHWIFKNTGLAIGDTFGFGIVQNGVRKGIVSGEIDNTHISWAPFPYDILAERSVLSITTSQGDTGYVRHQMVYYEDTTSNARVFAQGAAGWIVGLSNEAGSRDSDVVRIKTITINIISHFSGKKYLGKVYTADPQHPLQWNDFVELDGNVHILSGRYLRLVSPAVVTVGGGDTLFIDGTLEINGNVILAGPGTVNVGSTGQIVFGTGARLTLYPTVKFQLNAGIANGWNMTGIPAVVPSYLKDSVYLTRTSRVFEYTNTGYVDRDTLKSDRGWWVRFGSDTVHSYQGRFIDSMAMHVYKGWNIIGSISSPVDTGLLYTDPPGIWSHIIFKYSAAGYTPATTLYPGAGYWTKTSDSGKVILNLRSLSARPNSGPGPLSKLNGGDPSSLDTYDRFTVTDANGNRQSLYVRNASLARTMENIEMPPPLPDHSFDVRFSPGDFLQSVLPDSAGIDLSIALNTVTYPVHLTWAINPDNGLTYVLPEGGGGLGKASLLAQSTSMTIQNRADGFVHLKVLNGKTLQNQIPTQFSLQQNYPNPFNPLTTINFALPVDAHTHLKLYDVLGREVTSLVDEDRQAGYHKASFDGSRFSSGVYFYRMQAGSFASVKKLVLLK